MRLLILSVAIALLGSVFADEENVLVLDESNFESAISSNAYILVEFYTSSGCDQCKSLAPEYAEAATTLLEEGSAIKLAKVDATQEQELAEQYGVREYPTLKFFKNGNALDYSGGNQADDIVAWLKEKTAPPAVEVTSAVKVTSAEQAKELIEANKVIVFGFFPDQTTAKAKAFLTAADSVDEQVFAIVADEKVVKELEAEPEDVVLYKTKDSDFDKYLQALNSLVKSYSYRIISVVYDADEDFHKRILELFGDNKEEVPSLDLIDSEQDNSTTTGDELTASAVKSSPYVKELRAGSFDRIVFDTSKNVLVEFFSPSCQLCNALVPVYNEVGEYFRRNSDVLIARIDTSVHSVHHTTVTQNPIVKLYTHGNQGLGEVPVSMVRDFNGPFTRENLINFVNSNAGTPFICHGSSSGIPPRGGSTRDQNRDG